MGQTQAKVECRYCASERVVPVLDKRLHNSPSAGNHFRDRCLHCERWLPRTSKQRFIEHANSKVLPPDSDPQNPTLVDLSDYEFADELNELIEKSENSGTENEFRCPVDGCEAEHDGYPDYCEECGTKYNW